MDCFLETAASMWLMTRKAVGMATPNPSDENVQESLEECRVSLEEQAAEMAQDCRWIGMEALKKRKAGDSVGALNMLKERRRKLRRLEKLRNNITLVVGQIEALESMDLDKKLMRTLQVSSAALKQAGVGTGVKDAEEVMSQLDEQMRQSSELTSVLSGPINDDLDFDVDEEFEELLRDAAPVRAIPSTTSPIATVNSTAEPPVKASVLIEPVPQAELVLPTRVPQMLF
jgi:hypothetical protein